MIRSIGFVFLIAWSVLATPAMAADKPEIAPIETWVHQAPPIPEPMKAAAGAALAALVQDAQIRFDGDGLDYYQGTAIKVQTAQGLQALSTLSLAWSPATDRLVVHRLQILRGGQSLDMLPKDGVFTIARREEKLDSEGRLDGVLTAIVKIDGLQVGDVIDMAYTIHRHDPLFKNRVDEVTGIEDVLPIAYDRIRMIWPQTSPARWKASGGMAEPQVTRRDGLIDAEIVSPDVIPLIKPQGAPLRFRRGREFSISSYAQWADVSAAMASLFNAAVKLKSDSPLKAQAATIAAGASDPRLRAAAALALVQDKIRYLAQTLGEGGYKPAAADDTWERRYGDCKAKTTLLLALLDELEIKAEPVLVSTTLGQDLDTRLPSLAVFNHVMVRATIDGQDYWLDGTRAGDLSLAALPVPDVGYVLPLRSSGASLLHIKPGPFEKPAISAVIRLDASKGVTEPAAAHAETTYRGDAATVMRLAIANLSPADLDRDLRKYWRDTYDYISVTASKAAFNLATGEETLTMDGEAKLDWSGGYEPDGASVGWRLDTVRDPVAIHPDAPFAVNYPVYEEHDDTIILPDHGRGFNIWGVDVDRRLAGYALMRKASIVDGVFHMTTSSRALASEIPFDQAKADAEPLTALSKTTLRVRAPANAKLSDKDAAALLATTPSSAGGYLERGNTLLNARRFKDALSDFNHAVQLDPTSAKALGDRALAHVWLGDDKAALADADLAEQLDSREPTLYRARGLAAERKGNWSDAIANFTRSIDLQPEAFGYYHRAQAYLMSRDYPRALRDLDAELKLVPNNAWLHIQKANAYVMMKLADKARAELDAVKAAAADDDRLRASRLALLVQLGDRKTARAEVDAAIAAHPTAANYLQRASIRENDDFAGKEADAAAAHAADPKSVLAVRYLTAERLRAKDYASAAKWADLALTLDPNDLDARFDHARVLAKQGNAEQARTAFSAIRREAKGDAQKLNSLCYEQAIADFDLPQALADCDASLSLHKVAATVDSRGFVLLRLGRNQEALAAFDDAISSAPNLAVSLYGRSLVENRLGDMAAAAKDKDAALAISPQIVELFDSYGVSR